jgi:hypothetical protein
MEVVTLRWCFRVGAGMGDAMNVGVRAAADPRIVFPLGQQYSGHILRVCVMRHRVSLGS